RRYAITRSRALEASLLGINDDPRSRIARKAGISARTRSRRSPERRCSSNFSKRTTSFARRAFALSCESGDFDIGNFGFHQPRSLRFQIQRPCNSTRNRACKRWRDCIAYLSRYFDFGPGKLEIIRKSHNPGSLPVSYRTILFGMQISALFGLEELG